MKLNKKHLNNRVFAIVGLILLFSVIIFAAIPNNGHSSSEVCVRIDGTERTLQSSIDNKLLAGNHTYSSCASVPAGGHNANQIWVSVNGNENTLVNKLNSVGKICGSTSVPYNQSLNPGQLASEIEIITSGSSETFQQAINEGKFCLFCGDGTCNNGETCSSCASDCGACCTPITSCGGQCGTISDGCGGTLNCGSCCVNCYDTPGACGCSVGRWESEPAGLFSWFTISDALSYCNSMAAGQGTSCSGWRTDIPKDSRGVPINYHESCNGPFFSAVPFVDGGIVWYCDLPPYDHS
jgi:hypothetical protein